MRSNAFILTDIIKHLHRWTRGIWVIKR